MAKQFEAIGNIGPLGPTRKSKTIKARIIRLWSLPPYDKDAPKDAEWNLELILCDNQVIQS